MLNKDKEQLFKDNYKIIYDVMNKMNVRGSLDTDLDDYFQIGSEGLLQAIENYDESKGAFSTLAYICVRNAIGYHMGQRSLKRSQLDLNTVSYNVEVPSSGNTDEKKEIIDLFADPNSFNGYKDIDRITLSQALEVLTEEERRFFDVRFLEGTVSSEVKNCRRYTMDKLNIGLSEFKAMDRIVRGKIAMAYGIKYDIADKKMENVVDKLLEW